MKNRWNDEVARSYGHDPLALRVYSSRLLGQEEDLVLHGGGNTSVKLSQQDLFGEQQDLLYVKGSGWDLATIEKEGFAPVRLDALQRLATLSELDDLEMVRQQRMAMTDPNAPNPSVEAILHAIIPFRFVDHTHADAVVTISNTPDGAQRIRDVYGDTVLIVPYVMPGFVLAREIHAMTRDLDWSTIRGMILMHHGVFTFADDARTSYTSMIELVSMAEDYLAGHAPERLAGAVPAAPDFLQLARLRHQVGQLAGQPILAQPDHSGISTAFSNLSDVRAITGRGPLTPDHIIRTKRTPVVIGDEIEEELQTFVANYQNYFTRCATPGLTQLDPAPRWAIWPGHGIVAFGPTVKHLAIIRDIAHHTMQAIHQAEQLGGWTALDEQALFEMEYWSLEQAKLRRKGSSKPLEGRIALVTGAASGIGRACVHQLREHGAVVAALDINAQVMDTFEDAGILPVVCDVTSEEQIRDAIRQTVGGYGGLDMIISNAGVFPPSATIDTLDDATWARSLDVNLTSHRLLIKCAIPFLEHGWDPAIVIMGSKNVAAPGPGAAAYSVAKAGLAQLARVAALELGEKGIRVNVLHPNAVFDTGIWSEEVLRERAAHYGLSVAEYKTNNVLGTEVRSTDVAALAVCMLGPIFAKTTGAQVPVDGGNDRVI
ncbi:MAG: bifunctional aldolase/short-chain dehydrogenase [Saprospiraceae bacterium]|nr:bifunctional aldolase/short-chain dehydrogenase [Saprospiraceae bacterium]